MHAVQGSLCFREALLQLELGTLFPQAEIDCEEMDDFHAMSDDLAMCQHDPFAPA